MTPEELEVLRRWLKRLQGRCPASEVELIREFIERHEAPVLPEEKLGYDIQHVSV